MGPEQHADCQRDEVDGGVEEKRAGQLVAFQDSPGDVRGVVNQDREEEPSVGFPGGGIEPFAQREEDVLVLNQQD